ncbi:MAG: hypothetical protein JXX14_24845 [Deltaproteobacteria bacterium]|nr:hypothetical protein [Deltaproteobacteria bacterium]
MKNEKSFTDENREQHGSSSSTEIPMVVDRALTLIERGFYEEADLLVSAELLFSTKDAQLWFVAGLTRFQKGNVRTARSAFKMCAWLSGNAFAHEMAKELGHII